jgi:hypothetical protein
MNIDPQSAEEIVKSPWLAGALGALVAMGRATPGATWQQRSISVATGALLSGFFSPALSEYFGMTTDAMQSAMSFAVGLFGLNLMAAALAWTKDVKLSEYIPWRRNNSKTGDEQ